MCCCISRLYRNAMSSQSCRYIVITTSSGVKSKSFQKIDLSWTVLLDGCIIKILLRNGHTQKSDELNAPVCYTDCDKSIIKSANIHRKKVFSEKRRGNVCYCVSVHSDGYAGEIICILVFEYTTVQSSRVSCGQGHGENHWHDAVCQCSRLYCQRLTLK